MSETPGQVLLRVMHAEKGNPYSGDHGISYVLFTDGTTSNHDVMDRIAAAFLAEVDTMTLLRAAKERVGHSSLGGWGDEG